MDEIVAAADLRHPAAPHAAHNLQGRLNLIGDFNLIGASIYRVSEQSLDKLTYQLKPTAVGLGLFHNNLDSPYQALKLQYLNEYRARCSDTLETLWEVVAVEGAKFEEFYFPKPTESTNEMIEIMLVDATFVLELFHKYEEFIESEGALQAIYKWIPNHIMKTIRKDLLMFENQIPFSVIQRLYCKQNGAGRIGDLIETCMKFFGLKIPEGQNLKDLRAEHLLSLYYHFYCPKPTAHTNLNHTIKVEGDKSEEKKKPVFESKTTVPTASNLRETGIQFSKSQANGYVRFFEGQLELPTLVFDDLNRCALANIVIYEGVRGGKKPMSSLCFFLNSLMRSDGDVNILSRRGIIENTTGNDKDIVDFFSHICTDVEISSNEYLSQVIQNVNLHFQSKYRRWFAVITREHFRWPWSIIVFLWGIILAVANLTSFIFNVRKHL